MPDTVQSLVPERSSVLKRLARIPGFSSWMPLGTDTASRNIRYVLLDGVGVAIATVPAFFLPILLARLGASDFQVGLLSSMPALAGLVLVIPISRWLARVRQVAPWYAGMRLIIVAAYALSGLATLFAADIQVVAILIIWALATLPQTIVDVTFTMVMGGAAGPDRRFYLMSRRWSSIGIIQAVTVALTGVALTGITFPLGYQIVFPALAATGLLAYYYASRIRFGPAAATAPKNQPRVSLWNSLKLARRQSKFVRFTAGQLVYRFGIAWGLPLFPLFYVHTLHAQDQQIGLITTVNSAVLLVAYFMWARITKRRGSRFALLTTTAAVGLYPILVSLTTSVALVIVFAGLAGIFAAGIDLVFFDSLVSSYPPDSSALYLGLYQTTVYIATFAGPLVGAAVSQVIGIPAALALAGVIRLVGWGLFVVLKP